MNRSLIFCFVIALGLACAVSVRSQSAGGGAQNSLQQLEAVKAANAALLDKQTALLQKLDALKKDAEQTKFMVKRG